MARNQTKTMWGSIDMIPPRRGQRTGKYRARYFYGDKRYSSTFITQGQALDWLSDQRTLIARGIWTPPSQQIKEQTRGSVNFKTYANNWVETRENSHGELLSDSTKEKYVSLIRASMKEFYQVRVSDITQAEVQLWWSRGIASGKKTTAAKAYSLLHSIMQTAVDEGLLTKNPCQVKGGSQARTGNDRQMPTDEELDEILGYLREHRPQYVLPVKIAAWANLRWGELTSITKKDVEIRRTETKNGTPGKIEVVYLDVNKEVVKIANKGRIIKKPKSAAGVREVPVTGALAEEIAEHVEKLESPDSLLFATKNGDFLPHSTFNRWFKRAAKAAGRPELQIHGLRHHASTKIAQQGATVKEIQAFMGQSTSKAAMVYQHAEEERLLQLTKSMHETQEAETKKREAKKKKVRRDKAKKSAA